MDTGSGVIGATLAVPCRVGVTSIPPQLQRITARAPTANVLAPLTRSHQYRRYTAAALSGASGASGHVSAIDGCPAWHIRQTLREGAGAEFRVPPRRDRRASRGVWFIGWRGYPPQATRPDARIRSDMPDAVSAMGVSWTATRGVAGWRGRIRTFDLLIQSQAPYRLATRQWSGGDDTASPGPDRRAATPRRARYVRGSGRGVVRTGIVGA